MLRDQICRKIDTSDEETPLLHITLRSTKERGIRFFLESIYDTVHDFQSIGYCVPEIRFESTESVKIFYRKKKGAE